MNSDLYNCHHQSALAIVKNPVQCKRSKHLTENLTSLGLKYKNVINILDRFHLIQNVADIFTKLVIGVKRKKFVNALRNPSGIINFVCLRVKLLEYIA